MSVAEVGAGALRVAFVVVLWGLAASAYAAKHRQISFLASARRAAAIVFALLLVAVLAMVAALLNHDFTIAYVANNNARETPAFYSAISLWGALEGSILLWALILAGASAWVAFVGTRGMPRLATTALAILFAMLTFFLGLVVTVADPFVLSPVVPANGRGPNPLLQNHPLMALHPPLLYLGYVLLSIPFAYAIAALILGETGDRWLTATRRAALSAWALLGLGLAAGAWWGYGVLGWGGYWAWDPVENAALMPWLTATAYLHSVMVEERRAMLRVWNLCLVIATFALTILGTFLTRSGVVNSVHSFTQSAIGPLILGYLAVILVGSAALMLWRAPQLRDRESIGTPLSREAVFLFQNVLFAAATFTVLLGTLYPLFAEAFSDRQLSIGGPYFNRLEIPLGLALLFLMGVGPQLPWHGASRATLERQFTVPVVAAAALALFAFVAGTEGVAPLLTYALAGFVTATIGQEFVRGIRARRILHREAPAGALLNLFRRNGRRYGGYVVHFGIVLVAVAITASQTGTLEIERTLAPGDALTVGRYQLRLIGVREQIEPQRTSTVADLEVTGDGRVISIAPALTAYPNATQAIATPAITAGLEHDLYGVLVAYDARAHAWATLRIKVIPLVSWIWIGAAVVGVGALIAALPPPRRRRPAAAAVYAAAALGD